jgi:hypothetical protein
LSDESGNHFRAERWGADSEAMARREARWASSRPWRPASGQWVSVSTADPLNLVSVS